MEGGGSGADESRGTRREADTQWSLEEFEVWSGFRNAEGCELAVGLKVAVHEFEDRICVLRTAIKDIPYNNS